MRVHILHNRKNYASDYTAEPTSVSNKAEEKDISTLIENINNAVVGISKIANKGTTIFLQDGASNLGLGTGFIVSMMDILLQINMCQERK